MVWVLVDGGCDVVDAFILEGLDVVLLIVVRFNVILLIIVRLNVVLLVVIRLGIILLLLRQAGGNAHPGISKAIKDINTPWSHTRRWLRHGLQHWCHKAG